MKHIAYESFKYALAVVLLIMAGVAIYLIGRLGNWLYTSGYGATCFLLFAFATVIFKVKTDIVDAMLNTDENERRPWENDVR